MPTGLFGPGGMVALAWAELASQNSLGLYLNSGFRATPRIFHSPSGSGSRPLPVEAGNCAITASAASNRVTVESDLSTTTRAALARGAADARLGTTIDSPARLRSLPGLSSASSAGLVWN